MKLVIFRRWKDDKRVCINLDELVYFVENRKHYGTTDIYTTKGHILVYETFEDVICKIEQSLRRI